MKDELLYPKEALENAYKNGKLDLLTQLITEVEGMTPSNYRTPLQLRRKVITLLKNKRDEI